MVPHITAPIPNLSEMTDSIQGSTKKYLAVIDLANMFCSVPLLPGSQLQFAFTLEEAQYTSNWLPMGHFNSSTIGHNLCWQNINHIQLSPGA